MFVASEGGLVASGGGIVDSETAIVCYDADLKRPSLHQ
jgi:hypothetical protein